MKLLLFTALVLVVISLIEVEAENERACIPLEKECTKTPGNCCSGLRCDCYRRFEQGVAKGIQCWCIEKDVTYKGV
uniref:U6-lycotoxin-Ls1e n=1 Tax=Lycosa singoriensis TaxID=434756 RepID=TX605_LYCSI|nr:RecName: Full=U6-lycotoxin-Ls1e; AltName: Full=Toxin-like structure LSTX-F5; Flags: Precursor [Lycosa singoriensis]ACI41371.1 toxin-like structure LSTX-F5 precursor [Lycosa singoriensis]CAS03640.1 toxin-like structure LSTX-F5 precursor [Lycosa singoriensis]